MQFDQHASSTSRSSTSTTTTTTFSKSNYNRENPESDLSGDGSNGTITESAAAPAESGSGSESAALRSPDRQVHSMPNGRPTDSATTLTEGINPLGLDLKIVPGRGRGVFAREDIPSNTLLEESPVLPLTKEQWEGGKMNDTILGEYGFCWSNGGMAIALGLGRCHTGLSINA